MVAKLEVRQTGARLTACSPVLLVPARPGFLENCMHVLCGLCHSGCLKTLSGQHCHSGDKTPSHPCQGDTLTPLHTRAVIFFTMVSPVREVQTFEQKKGNVQKLQLDMALAAVVTSELEACYHQNLPHEIIGEIFSIYESKLVCRKPMEYQDWVIPFYITKIHLGKLSCTFN